MRISPAFLRVLWQELLALIRRKDRRQAALAAAQQGLDRRKP